MRNKMIILAILLLAGCTTYKGASYIKDDLNAMKCSPSSAQRTAEMETAKSDCMKSAVDEEYLKNGVSMVTIDWIKEVSRSTYHSCMSDKGFACSW